MSVKTTGGEFKRFYTDPSVWKNDGYYNEDLQLTSNGVDVSEDIANNDVSILPDNAKIVLLGGYLNSPEKDEPEDLCTVFRRWQKKNNTNSIVLEFAKADREKLLDVIKNSGIKVKIC